MVLRAWPVRAALKGRAQRVILTYYVYYGLFRAVRVQTVCNNYAYWHRL